MKNVTISRILLFAFIITVILIVINGIIENKKAFKEMVFGVVQKKMRGSKGSVILMLKNNKEDSNQIRYSFGDTRSIYHEIKVGDSVLKPANSYMFYLYRKANEKRYLIQDSIEIYHW